MTEGQMGELRGEGDGNDRRGIPSQRFTMKPRVCLQKLHMQTHNAVSIHV